MNLGRWPLITITAIAFMPLDVQNSLGSSEPDSIGWLSSGDDVFYDGPDLTLNIPLPLGNIFGSVAPGSKVSSTGQSTQPEGLLL